LHFERVQAGEIGNLLEGERGIFSTFEVMGGSRYAKAPGVVARR
jgi:hypothetical protein